jgi:4-amino-4-deoxy-L-arabinose transferase-like glycosyltransferase
VLAAIICATSPMYFFVARQAITDMPYVGPMTAGMGLGAVALFANDEELPLATPLRWLTLSLVILVTVPQLVYDSIALRVVLPLGRHRLVCPGVVAMAPYLALLAWLTWRLARARQRSQLLLAIAYLLIALAGLAKGLAAIGLSGLLLLSYLACARDWAQLRRIDVLTGTLLIVVVAFPWYHAMLIRHGMPFWNELFGDNHFRRLVVGRHGDRGSFDYYLRELGFGLFPWTAIAAVAVPVGIAAARPVSRRGRFLLYVALWAGLAYAVVTLSMTKFHHYVLPAVPAIAILCAWLLDSLLDRQLARAPTTALLLLFGVPLLGHVTWNLVAAQQSPQHLLWLFNYDYINNSRGRAWPSNLDYRGCICGFAALAGLSCALLCWRRAARIATSCLCACGLAFAGFALDKMLLELSPHWSQKHLLATYFQQKQPGDRLVAWNMFWRSETFYSENELYDPKLPSDEKSVFAFDNADRNLSAWIGRHGGKRVFFLLDAGRLGQLKLLLPESARGTLSVADSSNNKFVLAVATL